MMPALIAIVALSIGPADTWTPPAEWLDRTLAMESSGRHSAIGDRGKSRGGYQIQERIWKAYGGTAPWHRRAHDPGESRKIAALILRDCARACRRHGQAVTFERARWYFRHGGF